MDRGAHRAGRLDQGRGAAGRLYRGRSAGGCQRRSLSAGQVDGAPGIRRLSGPRAWPRAPGGGGSCPWTSRVGRTEVPGTSGLTPALAHELWGACPAPESSDLFAGSSQATGGRSRVRTWTCARESVAGLGVPSAATTQGLLRAVWGSSLRPAEACHRAHLSVSPAGRGGRWHGLSQAGGTWHLQTSMPGAFPGRDSWALRWLIGLSCVPCSGRGSGGPRGRTGRAGAGPRLPEMGPQHRFCGGTLLLPAAVGCLCFNSTSDEMESNDSST